MKKRVFRTLACVCAAAMLLTFPGCTGSTEEESGWKPSSSVNLIVPFAPGGAADLFARTIADYIDLDGQTMYITNIEGGSGTIGSMEAYHSKNDGLTLLSQALQSSISAYVAGTIEVDLGNELVWVSALAEDANVLAVAANSPYETLEDVLTAAKEHPNTLTLAALSSATMNATVQNILRQTDAAITYVPYDSGAKARTAVLGGHEDLLYVSYSTVKQYVDSGDLRPLALSTEERLEMAPDIPTFRELGYDVVYEATYSVMLPPETDEEIARYYETKLKEVFENEDFQTVMRETLCFNTMFIGMDELQDKVAETRAWAEEYLPLAMNQ